MRTRKEAVAADSRASTTSPACVRGWSHEMFGLEYGVGDVDKNGRSNAKDGWSPSRVRRATLATATLRPVYCSTTPVVTPAMVRSCRSVTHRSVH